MGVAYAVFAREQIDANVTPSSKKNITQRFFVNGQHLIGWFDWGGTPLKKYQGRPKVCSSRSEICCRGQDQKQA
jgi:hypothetical protein